MGSYNLTFNSAAHTYAIKEGSADVVIDDSHKTEVKAALVEEATENSNNTEYFAEKLNLDKHKFWAYLVQANGLANSYDTAIAYKKGLSSEQIANGILKLDEADGKLDGKIKKTKLPSAKKPCKTKAPKPPKTELPEAKETPKETPKDEKPTETAAETPVATKPTLLQTLQGRTGKLLAALLLGGAAFTLWQQNKQNRANPMPPEPVYARSMPPSNQNLFGGVPFNGSFNGVMMG